MRNFANWCFSLLQVVGRDEGGEAWVLDKTAALLFVFWSLFF